MPAGCYHCSVSEGSTASKRIATQREVHSSLKIGTAVIYTFETSKKEKKYQGKKFSGTERSSKQASRHSNIDDGLAQSGEKEVLSKTTSRD